jgi:methylenetetrahydrofolate reductase (NADPH)
LDIDKKKSKVVNQKSKMNEPNFWDDRERAIKISKEVEELAFDSGADFVITQLFFDNKEYFDYVDRLRHLGVTARVIPGILPITHYPSLLKFCGLCGATVTQEVKNIFEPIQEDKEATLRAGIKFAVRQCRDLLDGGAPGLHFYSLNKFEPTATILSQVRG